MRHMIDRLFDLWQPNRCTGRDMRLTELLNHLWVLCPGVTPIITF